MNESYSVQLRDFEGPLDLLLHLIETQKMAIADIQIASITDQYMSFLRDSISQKMDVASEFIVMASTLIAIKARALLPKASPSTEMDQMWEEADPELLLKERLQEYRAYKEYALILKQREDFRQQLVGRLPISFEHYRDKPVVADFLQNVTPTKLARLYLDILKRWTNITDVEVYRDHESIPMRMTRIEQRLHKGPAGFHDLLENRSRREFVVVLLSLLELIHLRKVQFKQERMFGEIWIQAL